MSALPSPYTRRRASTRHEIEDARQQARIARALRINPAPMPLCMTPMDIFAQDAVEGRGPGHRSSSTTEIL